MFPALPLITALIRLMGLWFFIMMLDGLAAPLFSLIVQEAYMPLDMADAMPNPVGVFIPLAAFYLAIAVALFFLAPRLARIMVPTGEASGPPIAQSEALLFCTGLLIAAWAFARVTDTIYDLMLSAAVNDGPPQLDEATLLFIFLTAGLLGAGLLIVFKFHKIAGWMAARRNAANKDKGGADVGDSGESP